MPLRGRLPLLCLLGLVGCLGTDPPEEPPSTGEDDTVKVSPPLPRNGVYPAWNLDAASRPRALEAMSEVTSRASVVALGESVRSSAGLFEAKRSALEYLIDKRGFRTLALEAPWERAEHVQKYVAGDGDSAVAAVTLGLPAEWRSEESVRLVRWLRERNDKNPDDKVTVFGFDVRQVSRDLPALQAFFGRVARERDLAFTFDLSACRRYLSEWPLRHLHLACLASLQNLEGYLTENEAELRRFGTPYEVREVRIRIAGARTMELARFYGTPDLRELGLARPVVESWEQSLLLALDEFRSAHAPGAPVVLWTHNMHIAHKQPESRGELSGVRSLGTMLRQRLGEGYQAIAFTARSVETTSQHVLAETTVETRLSRLGHPALFLDLGPRVPEPMFSRVETISMGSEELVPASQFSGIFFVDTSPAINELRQTPLARDEAPSGELP